MGQAKRRGTFEERKAQAIANRRDPEVRRLRQREERIARAAQKHAIREHLRRLQSELIKFSAPQ